MRRIAILGAMSTLCLSGTLQSAQWNQENRIENQQAFEMLFKQVELLSHSVNKITQNQFATLSDRQQYVYDTVEQEKISEQMGEVILKQILERQIAANDPDLDQKLRAVHRSLLALAKIGQHADSQLIDCLKLAITDMQKLFPEEEASKNSTTSMEQMEQEFPDKTIVEAQEEKVQEEIQVAQEVPVVQEEEVTIAVECMEPQVPEASIIEAAEAFNTPSAPSGDGEIVEAESKPCVELTQADLNRIRARARAIAKTKIRARHQPVDEQYENGE